jgi:hypothetical protein
MSQLPVFAAARMTLVVVMGCETIGMCEALASFFGTSLANAVSKPCLVR